MSELLPGEEFAVLEYSGGWAWGYCRADHRVGYVEAIALVEQAAPTHIVCEACAPISAGGAVTAPTIAAVPMGSRLFGHEDGACLITDLGCVPTAYLRRIGDHEDDPVVIAERLLGAPWRQGGRTLHGIDGPGLVQLALSLCGIPGPREPDLQQGLGVPVPQGAPLKRSDLVFFDGHAAMMVDDLMLIHASAELGKVAVEPFQVVERRDRERGGKGPLARRRL